MTEQQYAGFWVRTGAHVIDTILVMLILSPLLGLLFGGNNIDIEAVIAGEATIPASYWLSQSIPPAIAVIAFWYYKTATPGKMIVKVKIVDFETGEKPTLGQLIGRYFAYIASMVPLFLGLIWVAFDKQKRGWHDKLSGTAVVKR